MPEIHQLKCRKWNLQLKGGKETGMGKCQQTLLTAELLVYMKFNDLFKHGYI